MKKILNIALVGSFCMMIALISGCNTVKGFGKDVSNGGKDIQKAASH